MSHSNVTVSVASSNTGENGPHQNVPNPFEDCRRIQVSREKRPLNFFVTLTKKFLVTDDMVQLSGLGLAVTTVVTIVETLKAGGYVTLNRTLTSLVSPLPGGPSLTPKAKIQMWICKTADFDRLIAQNPLGRHYRRGSSKLNGNGQSQGPKRGGPSGEASSSGGEASSSGGEANGCGGEANGCGGETSSGDSAEAGNTSPSANGPQESEEETGEVAVNA